jgi:selenocysteine lyase/cysteine desulfurase
MKHEAHPLIDAIQSSIIGDNQVIEGPYGPRRVTYADYTASGRSLTFLEDFIRNEVMPLYANTHTETSGTGLQTTRFREDAREIIHRAVGGTDEDCVIFCGSGATGAINKLIDILNLRIPADLDDKYHLQRHIPEAERPVVFIGPYEHHSNELPWRESIAEVITIFEDSDGQIDLEHLEAQLKLFQGRSLLIGSFSAASNVTGISSQTYRITALLHQYGAVSFWDFAAAAPYVSIEMNPQSREPRAESRVQEKNTSQPTKVGVAESVGLQPRRELAKDAIFISPHKFIGGPGTPGVLVVKKYLLKNRVPSSPGGGTVAYVNTKDHRYLSDPVHREEGGTPAIIESIRAGLVFQLKESVGEDNIAAREEDLITRAIHSWSANKNLKILGNLEAKRLSIVSFVVRHGEGSLHHNFVVALLNDLFGIQARGGCSCAGPYGHRLLGIDLTTSHEFECAIIRGVEGIKPGWVRVNLNYFISEVTFQFLLDAIHFVAEHGWKFLPHYRLDLHSGQWTHKAGRRYKVLRLTDLTYQSGKLEYRSRHSTEPEWVLPTYIKEAHEIAAQIVEELKKTAVESMIALPESLEVLRWFPLPSEIHFELQGKEAPTHCRFSLERRVPAVVAHS